MKKEYYIEIFVSVLVGFILVLSTYMFAYYLLLLCIATVIVAIIVVTGFIKKSSEWKTPLRFLSYGYLAAMLASFSYSFKESLNAKERDSVISALYSYKEKSGHFPKNVKELPASVASIDGNYVPDSSLINFQYYYRDLYGFPEVFSSKDSSWKR